MGYYCWPQVFTISLHGPLGFAKIAMLMQAEGAVEFMVYGLGLIGLRLRVEGFKFRVGWEACPRKQFRT